MNELFRIINGALRLDTEKVRNYANFLADKLEKEGEATTAGRLRKLLEETDHGLRPASVGGLALPVDGESRFPLLERVNLKTKEAPIVLPESQWGVVKEFLSVAKSYGQLEAEGIATSLAMVMYGPPGCGKSHLARYIARELGLPMFVARLDGLVSSYLGSTSKNIRAMFEFASKTPCVLFLDEFDAIAKLRGDAQELGELKRVVNSFIQNLDSVGQQSVVIAATNHEELLDNAVWRRFNYRIELGFPDSENRRLLWKTYLAPGSFSDKAIEILVDLSEGFSGAEIQDVCVRLRRLQILEKREANLHDAFVALQNLSLGDAEARRPISALKNKSNTEVAQILRNRHPRTYSHSVLAQLLGVSKATAQRLVVRENNV